ncbi:MAG: hypothetical protein HY343_05085 [Lentisphaerae bacterium]|nr:hypothetical protein [Lentisphaerota bacterium]
MPFRLFHDLFPEVAERETRTMRLLKRMFREKIDKKIAQPPKTEWWRKKRKLR